MCLLLGTMALLLSRTPRQRVYYEDGQYLVNVRGHWQNLRDFIQPSNPDVLAVYYGIGLNSWALYDFVCQNVDYRSDVRNAGEFWQVPSETLARGQGDCEDTSILLTSLLRNFTQAHVAVGIYQGYGHAWVIEGDQIYETTYTRARLVPDSQDYQMLGAFNDYEVCESYPGALEELFALRRDEATKLNLIARALEQEEEVCFVQQ